MSDPVWREVDYETAWTPFDRRFVFAPDFYERSAPAIRLPEDALVVDLGPIFESDRAGFAEGAATLDDAAFEAFARLAGDAEMVALDWQHPAYLYSPSAHNRGSGEPAIPVFPNGDYYAHMPLDLRWGTFGHPWQRTLTIWGDDLVSVLGEELLTWLPRHPQSPRR